VGPHLERALTPDGAAAPVPLELLAEDPSCAPLAVRAALQAGDSELAAGIVADIARLARLNRDVRSLTGCARHAESLVRRDVEGLREAVDILGAGPRPLALAAALEDLGLALAGDRREAAIRAFEVALAIYGGSGATTGAVRVRRELRALGARGRHRVAEQGHGRGWDSLTRTERAVAQLVADGLSNRLVAARLFVSCSTVDTHVQHIFGKLGINSRVRLARMVVAQTVR
jgi:DNA-binding CsgD family transcriptional regulator